ncbi:MAG: glycosyltransferase family 39 protein [Magnetococcales bacterium]|nr:glycosyltransferase family 39 protein [Magnetococcales bacterium]
MAFKQNPFILFSFLGSRRSWMVCDRSSQTLNVLHPTTMNLTPMLPNQERPAILPQFPTDVYDRLSIFILFLLALVMLATCRDYGYSYDEVWQNRFYGKAIISWYASLGADTRATNYLDLYLFGGLYDTIAEIVAWVLPFSGHTTRRLLNAGTGFFALLGAWRMASHLAGSKAGFWSLINLATIPAFYGHMFINAKDIPFAAGTIWSLHYLVRLAENPLGVSNKLLIKLGLSLALALGVRIGGVLLLGYAGIALLSGLWFQYCLLPEPRSLPSFIKQASLPRIIGIPLAIASFLTIIFWPALLVNPGVLLAAFKTAAHHEWGKSVLFKGAHISSSNLPWDYLPVYLGVSLPEMLAVLAIPILIWSFLTTWKHWQHLIPRQAIGHTLLLLATLLPLILVIVLKSVIYDGARHVMFLLPPFAVLSGIAFSHWDNMLARTGRMVQTLVAGVLIVYLGRHVLLMAELHPYQYTFYNVFSGGMPAASSQFETDYWMTSYREAARKVIDEGRKIAEKEHVEFAKRKFTVGVFYVPINIEEIMPSNFIVSMEDKVANPDFVIASTRWNAHLAFKDMKTIHRIERLGMLFAVVKSRLF